MNEVGEMLARHVDFFIFSTPQKLAYYAMVSGVKVISVGPLHPRTVLHAYNLTVRDEEIRQIILYVGILRIMCTSHESTCRSPKSHHQLCVFDLVRFSFPLPKCTEFKSLILAYVHSWVSWRFPMLFRL